MAHLPATAAPSPFEAFFQVAHHCVGHWACFVEANFSVLFDHQESGVSLDIELGTDACTLLAVFLVEYQSIEASLRLGSTLR